MRRNILKIKKVDKDLIALVITVLLGIIIIASSKFIFKGGFNLDKLNNDVDYLKAKVTKVTTEKLEEDKYIEDIKLGYQQVVLKLMEGSHKGEEFQVENNVSRLYNTIVKEGSRVVVAVHENNGTIDNVYIYSLERSRELFVLIALFIVVILLVGGIKGAKSLISLIFTLVCIIYLMLPLMLRGISPIISALIIAILSTTVTLILVSGINKKTEVTILGTLTGIIIAGLLAYIFGEVTNLSGINISDAESMMYLAETSNLKVKGLMFAGILVSSLGAVMDVAMSISSSMFEIKSINTKLNKMQLFKSGMNIGKDIIGTMTNTLILAFTGGALCTLILLYSAKMSFSRIINLDFLGMEIIQGLAGTIGIILTVPATVLLAIYYLNGKKQKKS